MAETNPPSFEDTTPVVDAPSFDDTEAIDTGEKKNAQSQSNSVDGTSGSTGSQSASEVPSIGKIKWQNNEELNLDKSKILKERIAQYLPKMVPAARESYLNTLASKGYSKDVLKAYADSLNLPDTRSEKEKKFDDISAKQSPEEKAKLEEHFQETQEKPGFVGELLNEASAGMEQGTHQVLEGVKNIAKTMQYNDVPVTTKLKDLGTGTLNVGAGGSKAAFAAAGVAVPELAIFNSGVKALNKLPDEGKKAILQGISPGNALMSNEDNAKEFDKILELPFTAATSIAEAVGYNPEEGSAGKATLDILNLLIPLGAGKVAGGIKSKINDVNDLKEISQKVTDGTATPEEIKDLTALSKGISEVNVDEVKGAAEEQTKVPNDELHTKLAELQAKTQEKEFDTQPPEVQDAIFQAIKDKQSEIHAVESKQIDTHLEDAKSAADIAEIDSKISAAQTSMKGTEGAVKETIQKHIDNLKIQKDALQKFQTNAILQRQPSEIGSTGSERGRMEQEFQGLDVAQASKEAQDHQRSLENEKLAEPGRKKEVINSKIQEAIDNGDIQEGSPEEKLARESLSKKYDNVEEFKKASNEMFRADEGNVAEAFLPRKKTGKGYIYKSSKNEYTVENRNGELSITNKIGEDASPGTRLKIVKDYEKKFDYSKGKSAFEGINPSDVKEEEVGKVIAEKSENPSEIIAEHERLLSEQPYEKGDAVDNAISENIGKVKRGSYIRHGDKNNITQGKAKAYFNESKGQPIDTLAQQISEDTGLNVTPDDIISFIDRHPNGVSDYTKSLKNPLITELKNRFKSVTGLTLNDRVVKAHDEQTMSKAEFDLINQNYDTAEQARAAFIKGIDSGEIKTPILPSEEGNLYAGKEGEIASEKSISGEAQQNNVEQPEEVQRNDGEEKITGIKKEVVNKEREERGLMPFEKKQREGNQERWDKVKTDIANGDISPKAIAEDVVANPRNISADEVAALDYHRIELNNKREGTMRRIEKAQESKDADAELSAQLELAAINEDIDLNDRAASLSGSEWGKSGQMRQRMFKNDYSMVALERKAKIANGGKTIPAETITKLKSLSEEIEAQKEIIDKLHEDKAKVEAQKVIDDLAIEQKVKEGIDKENQRISEAFFDKESKKKVDDIFKNIESKIQKLYNSKAANSSLVAIPLDLLHSTTKLVHGLTLRGMDLANAIKKGLNELSEYKDKFDEKEFIGLFDDLKDVVRTKPGKSHGTEAILSAAKKRAETKGKLPGLGTLLKKYVGEGITTIDAMVDKVYEDFKETLPDITKREVRDEISGYGKVSELSKEQVDVQLRKLKRVGSLMSALEDAHQNRIKRTGLQRDLPSEEEISLRKQINAAMRENQLSGENNPKSEMEWKTLLDKYKKRLDKKTLDLQDKIKKGDYAKKVKVPLVLDAEAIEAKKKYEKLKDQATREMKKIEDANKGKLERWKDNFLKFRRAMILSSLTTTVGKLGIAAGFRTAIATPLEALVSAGWSKVPIVRDIAIKAPRYGGPLHAKALAKGFAEWVKKSTWVDSKDILKGEKGELSLVHGHDNELPPTMLDMFNQIHKAVKNPAKKAEFATSLEKRSYNAILNGENISDPSVQARLFAEAYEDSNRAVFLQKNKITSGYEMFLRDMENKAKDGSVTGQIVAGLTRFLLPIVKVPTNFVAEQREYVAGITNIQVALRKGIENLTPEEADHVLRGLTRQSIGAGALLLGYYGYKQFGGYYRKGQDDKDGVKADDMELFGVKIPHWMQHVPALQAMQFGATVRRVQEYYKAKDEKLPEGEKTDKGFLTGVGSAAVGTLEHIPFLETPGQLMEALRSPEGRDKWVAQVAKSLVIPPDLDKLARYLDKDLDGNEIKRKPKEFLEVIEMGIPGMRQRVGTAYDDLMYQRTKSTSDEELEKEIKESTDNEQRAKLQEQLRSQQEDRRTARTDKAVQKETDLMKLGKALGKEYIPPKGQTNREKTILGKIKF